MSYIEKEALLKSIESKKLIFEESTPVEEAIAEQAAVFEEAIEESTAADVVPVVRCKDCIYWTGKDYDGCCIKNGLATRFAKDYCSYGERREE